MIDLSKGQYIAPSIKVIEDAIDNCDELISIAKSHPDSWKQSAIGGDGAYSDSVRVSSEITIGYGLPDPLAFYVANKAIYSYARVYAEENLFRFSHMEATQMLEYLPSEGFFDRHSDAGPEFPRSMSAILYLNDVEEGGETWFDKFGLSVVPQKGKLVLFPANFAYSHQAMPPTSGNKYILVSWFGMELSPQVFERYYK